MLFATVMYTVEIEVAQELIPRHSNVLVPVPSAVMVVVGLKLLVMVPVPALINHCPAPLVGLFAARVTLVPEQITWLGPASDKVTLPSRVMVT